MAMTIEYQCRNIIYRKSEFMFLRYTRLPTLRGVLIYALLPLFFLPAGAVAEGLRVTPYLGYRVGGEFEDVFTGTTLKLNEGESYGLIIGKDDGSSKQFEFLYSLQPTKLTAGGPVTPGVLVDVDVENYFLAGK
jgi:hypothetical protein